MIGAPNKTFLLGLQVLIFLSAFILFIACCVLAGGDYKSSRRDFMLVSFSLIQLGLAAATAFFVNKQLSPEQIAQSTTATVFSILISLYIGVFVGGGTSLSGSIGNTIRCIVAGASLLIIFHVAYLALVLLWKQQLTNASYDANQSSEGQSGPYQGGQNFQPSTYQNYEPPVSEYQNA